MRLNPPRLLIPLAALAVVALAVTLLVSQTRPQAQLQAGHPPALLPQAVQASDPTYVVAVGDIACEPGSARTKTKCRDDLTAKLTTAINPDLVFTLGDEQYEAGSYADFTDAYDTTWGPLKDRTFPTPGNHEYNSKGAAGYYRYFGSRTASSPGYYTFTTGSWRIYQLNSNCSKIDCAAELSWFKKQLKAHPAQCTLMAMHHPRYSSGQHGNTLAVRPFWRAAYAARVDVALSGHDHSYERFQRLDGDGHKVSNGITSYVSGAGGKNHYPWKSVKTGSRYRNNSAYGVLKLKLNSGGWAWSWRTVSGSVPDQGSRSCV